MGDLQKPCRAEANRQRTIRLIDHGVGRMKEIGARIGRGGGIGGSGREARQILERRLRAMGSLEIAAVPRPGDFYLICRKAEAFGECYPVREMASEEEATAKSGRATDWILSSANRKMTKNVKPKRFVVPDGNIALEIQLSRYLDRRN